MIIDYFKQNYSCEMSNNPLETNTNTTAAASAALVALNAFRYYEQMVDKNNNQFAADNVRSIYNQAAAAASTHALAQQFTNNSTHLSQLRLNNVADKMLAAAASAAAANYVITNNLAQQQQQIQTDDTKCHACGDKSTGSHFGGISCESCKAFFRRSVQRNRWEEYKCSYNGECKMNTSTRKICQYCRYNRCLTIGMRPKWVLSDDERQQKYGNRRKKHLLNQQQQQQHRPHKKQRVSSPDTSSKINDENVRVVNVDESDDRKYEENFEERFYKHGVDAINTRNKSLNDYDQILINKLTYAFYHSRQSHNLDLSNIQKKLQKLYEIKNDERIKLSKIALANFMVTPVKRVITFAKMIPDFRKLNIEDQMALLRGSTMEIFICSSQNLFDKDTNSFTNIVSKDRNIQGNVPSNIQLEILRFIWLDDVLDRTLKYLKEMNDLKIDETTLLLYIPLILFSPDRRDLTSRSRILEIQTKYSFLLYKYILYKYKSEELANNLYTHLLLKLIDLRELHELHSSILLDADSSQLELYCLDI